MFVTQRWSSRSRHVSIIWLYLDQGITDTIMFQFAAWRKDRTMKVFKMWGGGGYARKERIQDCVNIKRTMVSKRWRELDQDKKLMQSIPRIFLEYICAGRQTSKWISQIDEFLAIFCTILCNRHQFKIHLHFCLNTFYMKVIFHHGRFPHAGDEYVVFEDRHTRVSRFSKPVLIVHISSPN